MIRKLQLKFVSVCMALVTAVMAVVFVSLYISMRSNVEDLSRQVLHRVIQEDSAGPSSLPVEGIPFNGDRAILPFFTVNIWGDTAYVTGGTYSNLEDTAALEAIVNDCLSQKHTEGIIEAYHLRYLRRDSGLFQKIAFVDMSMEQAMLRSMMGPYLIIAAVALLLLLGISVLLSRWAVRPVERALQQQRQFLSDASHELKTPLTVILSNAELLADADLTANPARWTDNIRSEARQMKALVEEMLTLARADNAPKPAALAPLSFSDLAADCALAFEPVAFEAGKPLTYDLAENIDVIGNADRLRQLISVLLDNAIKYGAAGGTVHLSLRKTDRQAILSVSNTGSPIPADQLPHLFERFYRADASRGETSGFGLGLSIAKTISDEHRGLLRAESDPLSTRFYFSLPLRK